MITAEKLNELMREQYSYISYDSNMAEEFLVDNRHWLREDMTDDQIASYFADYVVSQDLADEVVE